MSRWMPTLLVPAVCAALFLSACPGTGECTASDECAANEVCRAGQCRLTTEEPDGGTSLPLTDGGDGDSPGSDAGTDAGTMTGSDAGHIGLCDNGDDLLGSDELPLALGAPLRFVEATNDDVGVPVDLTGAPDSDGTWTWDFSMPQASDASIELAGLPLDGFWFQNEYTVPTGATAYAIALNGSGENYAILARTDEELLMLGVASAAVDETALVYAPPVATVKFPLEAGQSWSVDTDVSGTFEGIFYSSTDHYEIDTVQVGEVITPAGRFRAWQLQLVLEVTLPILVFPFSLTYRYVRHSFMTPCYGQVAFAASFEDEDNNAFENATELRRLGLAQ